MFRIVLALLILALAGCGSSADTDAATDADTSAPASNPPTNAFDNSSDALRSTRSVRGYLPRFAWNRSLPIDSMAPGIGAFGGTEVRSIVKFDNKVFAAVGYWMDTEGDNPLLPGAQIIRLDSAGGSWQVDHELTDLAPDGTKQFKTLASMESVVFTRTRAGKLLLNPQHMLVAGTWSSTPGLYAFTRRSGDPADWREALLSTDTTVGTQLRSFIVHRDRVTQGELLFGGAQNAIFVGHYDPTVRDVIWTGPEWTGTFTAQKKTGLRVLGMAECNGKLYASVNGYVLERQDGPSPSWRVVAEVELKTSVSEGLRGLTAIANPSGNGEVLMAAAEDSPAIVYMIDPSVPSGDGYAVTVDQNISALITPYVSAPPVTYAVVAYNHMTVLPDATDSACPSLLLGMEVRTPNDPSDFGLPTHAVNPHAYFVVRDCHGNYGVRMVRDNNLPEQMLVSVRTLLMSPFADDPPGTVYAGGFDANKTPVHDSAWLYRGTPY